MPLLKRKPFSPKKTPPDLKPEEEVFVCRHTHEVFRDYGSFFERTILCNSLLWSCKFTGKSGLTYQEAHQSEKTIVKQAKSLPEPIQRAVLTVVHHTQRGRLANLCDEVFSYLKDRYQEGEEVEIHYPSRRKRGVITRVIPPEEGTSPSCRPTNSSKITDTALLSSPKPRKHSNSEEALHSHTSRKHHGTSERTPSKARKHSSSSDDRPLSTQVNKQNLDSVPGKSPSRKTPKKSFDEDTPSKSKARKHSVESSSEKSTPRKRSSSNGKDTPSKTSSGDKIVKKASVSSSKKGSEEKLVSPSKKSPSHGSTLESPKSKKLPLHDNTLESPKSKKTPSHGSTLESPKSRKSPSHDNTLESPKSKKTPSHDNTLESPKSKKSASHDNTLESPKSKKTLYMSERKGAESDVIVIDDMDNEGNSSVTSPKLSSPKEKPVYTWPVASLYKYEVRLVSERRDKGSKKKEKHCEVVVVHASIVSRRKGVFTRDKLKMLLKISCERSTPQSGDGFYIVQKDYRKIFDLGDPDVPLKLASPPKDKKGRKRSLSHGGAHGEEGGPVKKRRKKKEEQSKNNKEGTRKRKDKKDKDGKHEKKSKLTPEERKRIMEEEKEKRKKGIEEEKERRKVEREKEKAENKVKREEERAVKKLERDKERERLREEKRLEAIRLKEWSKPREDLELDDLMELPKTTPVTLKLSSELFGDMMMILEFLNIFGGIFDIKDEFPSGLSFGMLEEALTEHDAEGVYYDLLLFLLGAILRTHLEEEEEEGLDGSPDPEPVMDLDDDNDAKGATVSASAIMAAAWPMQHQGKRLHELIMDPFTSSELLRLHLLSSGARIGCGESSYRWQRRGGFTYNDDAGVEFRHAEPHLLKTLVTGNVYDMGPEDKLKIVMALCTQLMTYATARDYVEEGFDRCRKVRREWQEDQWADQRKGKEEAAARYRRKQEERQRQKEELERRKKEKDQERVDGARGESSLKPEDLAEQIPAEDPAQKESKQTPAEAKKGGKKKNTNGKESSQEDETKERLKSSGQVNGNKTPEEKECDSTPFPVLSKEEEEELAQQRREERRRKDHEFSDLLTKAWSRSGLQPLGRDRVFRRYWSFKSLRGLFVEDDDCGQHLLLQPDPDTEPEDEGEMSVEELKEEDEDIDKEKADTTAEGSNTIDLTMDQEQATPLVNGHTSIKTVKKNRASLEREIVNMFRAYHLTRDVSDNGKVCEVYKTRQVVKWSYFCSKEDLDELLDALNSRGCREKLLKEAIQQDYGRLVTAIEKCPLKLEVQAQKKDTKAKGRRGGRNQQAVDKSRYKTMEEFIEANLRDQILDLEERIWQGNLGAIKIDDREAWRAKVENGIYSQFCQPEKEASDGLTTPRDVNGVEENVTPGLNGSVESMDVDSCVGEDGVRRLETELEPGDTKGDEEMDGEVDQTAAVNGDADESKEELDAVSEQLAAVEEDRKEDELSFTAVPSYLKLDSRPSSPDTRTSTPTLSLVVSHLLVNPAVKELALDLLKVEQGIEQKYLNPPLGEDEETKRQRQREAAAAAVNEFNEMMKVAEVKEKQKKEKKKKESAAANDDNTAETKQSEEEKNGEEGDQISDNSTSSSEEPAKHKTRLERWEESLLSCTNLSQVFVHLNTLDQSIAWGKSVLNARCRLCRRKGDAEHMLLCDACDRGHHMYCLKPPIKEVPEGQWFCADCRPKETRRSERRKKPQLQEEEDNDDDKQEEEEEESSAEEEEEASDEDQEEESESESESDEDEEQTGESSENSQHGDQCALCTEGGELLCCDTCPLAYHLSCAYPSLRRIPRGNWACQVCTGADEERSRSCRVKKSTIEAAQKSLQRTIKVVKKKSPRASPRPGSRQEKKAPARSTKHKVSSSPSPPPRVRKADAKADKKSKRQRVSSSSSRSSSPAPRPTRRGSAKGVARGLGRSSIDSSRSSSPALRSESKKQASKGRPKLAAGRLVLCRKLLDELMKHDDAWPFLEAVDLAENPDYIKYVKEPMDLATIKENLSDKAYDSVEDFATHVRQVFINCSEYCRPRAKEARAGVRLSALFETKYSEMGLDAMETRATRSRRT